MNNAIITMDNVSYFTSGGSHAYPTDWSPIHSIGSKCKSSQNTSVGSAMAKTTISIAIMALFPELGLFKPVPTSAS